MNNAKFQSLIDTVSLNVSLPTKSNVDYTKFYVYNEIPRLKILEEEREMKKARIDAIKKYLQEDKVKQAEITVSINNYGILTGNHTFIAWLELTTAPSSAFNKPLWIRFVDVDENPTNIMEALTATEKSKKWVLEDYIKGHMKTNKACAALYDVVTSHPYLNKGKKYRVALSAAFGRASKESENIKKGTFKGRGFEAKILGLTKTLDEALMVREGLGMVNSGSTLEAFVAAWKEFKDENTLWFKYNSVEDYCKAIAGYSRWANAYKMEDVQQYDYWKIRFESILNYISVSNAA